MKQGIKIVVNGLILSSRDWIKRQRKSFGIASSKSGMGTINKNSRLRGLKEARKLTRMYLFQDTIESLAILKIDSVFMMEAGKEAINEIDKMIVELNKEQASLSLFYYDKIGRML